MAIVNRPPYLTTEDPFTEVDLETWSVRMTDSNNELDERVRVAEDSFISLSRLQSVVASSTSFADFQSRIAALT